jgi:hypothetical protein
MTTMEFKRDSLILFFCHVHKFKTKQNVPEYNWDASLLIICRREMQVLMSAETHAGLHVK